MWAHIYISLSLSLSLSFGEEVSIYTCVCVWWFVPNNFELLGLELQFIYTLDRPYPTMEGPKKWLVVSLMVLWFFLSAKRP